MNKDKIILFVFFVYFIIALLVHSVFITIEQSIYTYAIEKSKSSILLVIKYLSIILFSIFFCELTVKVSYRKLMAFVLIPIGFLCVLIPLLNNFLFPQLLYFFVGLGFVVARITAYHFIGQVTNHGGIFASLINRLEALFMLAFIVSWLLAGGFAMLGWTWTYFFWVIAGFITIAMLLLYHIDFTGTEEEVLEIQVAQKGKTTFKDIFYYLSNSFLKFYKSFGVYLLKMFYGSITFFSIFQHAMIWMLVLNLGFLSMVQVHFTQWIPAISKQYLSNLNINIYLMLLAFAGLFLGRIFASFVLRIFRPFYVLIASIISCIIIVFITAYYANDYGGMVQISHLSELPSFFWAIPLISFSWSPVMPTLSAIILSNVDRQRLSTITALIIFVIFIVEAAWVGVSASIFAGLNVNVAFVLGMLPIVLLLILSILFINDIKSKEKINTSF
ncbi:MAG: MFS transporter [Thermoflexibacter sp.]|nr:MFS transporter [Thermoflexibacter sp.]